MAGEVGMRLLGEFATATDGVNQARVLLRASAVPRPEKCTPVSAILRELAVSTEPLSAQQLAELPDPP